MLTPQELEEVRFDKAKIGGYVMKSVDDFLGPLIDDYLVLYKENAVLKSKMRLLVDRLEEYRKAESEMRIAIEQTQKTCASMVSEAERRSAEILRQADDNVKDRSLNINAEVSMEQERLNRAMAATSEYIAAVEAQIDKQQKALEALRSITPVEAPRHAHEYEAEAEPQSTPDQIAEQIEKSVGMLTDSIPSPEPDPLSTTRVMPPLDTARKEKHADLKFGKNYKA